mmetsp:Transcript_656/g.2434  ORF Transcript_656/g.2434 Transcript_656/m.2434 type:complete len:353 (+) Transcript_656:145-1203(+)
MRHDFVVLVDLVRGRRATMVRPRFVDGHDRPGARAFGEASRHARVSAASTFSSRGERLRAGDIAPSEDRIVPRAARLRLVRFRRQSRRRGQARVRRVRQGTQGAVPRRRHRQLSEVHPRQRGAHRQRGRHRSVQVFQVDEARGRRGALERPGLGREQRQRRPRRRTHGDLRRVRPRRRHSVVATRATEGRRGSRVAGHRGDRGPQILPTPRGGRQRPRARGRLVGQARGRVDHHAAADKEHGALERPDGDAQARGDSPVARVGEAPEQGADARGLRQQRVLGTRRVRNSRGVGGVLRQDPGAAGHRRGVAARRAATLPRGAEPLRQPLGGAEGSQDGAGADGETRVPDKRRG